MIDGLEPTNIHTFPGRSYLVKNCLPFEAVSAPGFLRYSVLTGRLSSISLISAIETMISIKTTNTLGITVLSVSQQYQGHDAKRICLPNENRKNGKKVNKHIEVRNPQLSQITNVDKF